MSTMDVSERSPLIEPDKPNMFARMPTIFAKNKDNDSDANSILLIPQGDYSVQSQAAAAKDSISNIARLVEQEGSAAYMLY